MSGLSRTVAGIRASTRSFVREPFTIGFLVVLPALSIQIYGVSMGQFPDVGLFETAGSAATTGRITGAVFASGALAGVLGLFQMISARNADRRLAICGFRGIELVVARFATVAVASALVGIVATVSLVALLDRAVGAPLAAFAGLLLAGAIYGQLGLVVGSVLPRELEGSLLLVIVADVDNVFASGLFAVEESVTRFAPLTHPHAIVTEAVVDGSLATGHLAPAVGHLGLFTFLGIATYTYRVESGGGV
ncbi:MAG: ABC-2 type transport system permease protein [Natronomonas sp.]|jgi:ABC-2 type transport system permease protein